MSVLTAILVVEPGEATRRGSAAALEADGLVVARTATGVEAIRRFRALQPRVVLVNDVLPDVGIEHVLQELRRDAARNRACVVLLSDGDVTPDRRLWAIDQGADDYVTRPADRPALVALVRTCLRQNERLEAALAESEWRFTDLAENIDEAFYNYDVVNDRLLYMTPAYERIWGRTLESVYENPASYMEAAHPEDRPVAEEVFRRQLTGEETSAVFRIVRPDGDVRVVSEHARPVLGANGRVERIIGTTRDITKATHQDRMRAWEARVFEAISKGVTLPRVLELIVRGAEEFTPHALASIMLIDEEGTHLLSGAAPSLPPAFMQAVNGGAIGPRAGSCGTAAHRGELVVVTDIASDPLWSEWADIALQHGLRACWSMPVRDGDGRVRATFAHYYREPRSPRPEDLRLIEATANVANIAIDRDRKDRALRTQARLLAKAHDAISVRGLDHRVTFWNNSASRLFGWIPAEAEGRSIRELVHIDDAAFTAALEATLKRGEWTGDLETHTVDGHTLDVESHWTLVRDDEGRPASILVIDTDVTERRRLEAHLLGAQRLESIGTLASGMAHDLNNLLAPITIGIDLLSQQVGDDDSREILSTMRASAAAGSQLLQQVLSFSRGFEGRRTRVPVGALVDDLSALFTPVSGSNIKLEVDVPADVEPAQGDPGQLSQVLLNLCLNARDAMPDGGTLTIRARNVTLDADRTVMGQTARAGRYVAIEVTDTGTGMPRRVVDRIFDPFFTTKAEGRGAGLGLPTLRTIVHAHGGFVDVQSAPGLGSTFRVYVPAAAAGDAGPANAAHDGMILVVDDQEALVTLARRTLEAEGYRVVTATDGPSAFNTFQARHGDISVVVADLALPVMGGVTLLTALRRVDPAVRTVGVAAAGATPAGRKTRGAGTTHMLTTPYTPAALLAEVRAALAGKARAPRRR